MAPKETKKGISISSAESRAKRVAAASSLRKVKREEKVNSSRAADLDNCDELQQNLKSLCVHGDKESASELEKLVEGMATSEGVTRQLECVKRLRSLIADPLDPVINVGAIISAGSVPPLLELMSKSNDHALQLEAVWTLALLLSGTHEHTNAVVVAGAVPRLLALLQTPHEGLQEQIVWALGNIAGDCVSFRDLVLSQGVLTNLQLLLQSVTVPSLLKKVAWLISNLCHDKPRMSDAHVVAILPLLGFIYSEDVEVLLSASGALVYLSEPDAGGNPNFGQTVKTIVEAGYSRRLVELLMHPNNAVKKVAAKFFANTTGEDVLTNQLFINCGLLPCLLSLMLLREEEVRKRAFLTVVNLITIGNQAQFQMIIDTGIVPAIISALESDLAGQAIQVVARICSGGDVFQINYMVNTGGLRALCNWCVLKKSELSLVLDAISNVLKATMSKRGQSTMNECRSVLDASGLRAKLKTLRTSGQGELKAACDCIEAYLVKFDSENT